MTSMYRRALGTEFSRLHPKIQERFGFSSADRIASIGTGIMDEVWCGPAFTRPFLYLGTWRNIMFPHAGRDVPFTVENFAYADSLGRETVTWVRKFAFPDRVRRFDATMIYSERRRRIVDYLGTHQHLAVDIDVAVGEGGGICIRSGDLRFYEGFIGFRFPLLFAGIASVCEWYDDAIERYRISVSVENRVWGRLFGYNGTFDAVTLEVPTVEQIPADVRPVREEARE